MDDAHRRNARKGGERQSGPEQECPSCGGLLFLLARTIQTESARAITYLRCQDCAHVKIIEE